MIIRRIKKTSGSLSVFLFALTLLLSSSFVLFSGVEVSAKTYYVKPSSEVVVRRGQGTDYKIIAMVKDGVAVEFLEENDSYVKVRLANDKEGWMLKRFLSDEPPLKELVVSLRAEKEEMKQREVEVVQKLDEVSSALAQTEMELDVTLAERDQVRSDYQTLQLETQDVVQIKKDLLETAKKNESLAQELVVLEQERNSLKQDYAIKWFLAGGGVLLVGMFIGMMFGRSRKRRSSLL